MATGGTRVQGLVYGLSDHKQADIATIASSFQRFSKLDMELPFLQYGTETDAPEIGKGHEFATKTFPTAQDFTGRCEKYGSAEFMLWAWAYALGDVGLAAALYTIHAADPGVSLELPYFSLVAHLAEGGGAAIDEAYLGLQIEDVMTTFNYGAGRATLKTAVNFVGSGRSTIPSVVSVPALLVENYMPAATMTVTINGVNYISTQRILSGSIGWKNNLLLGLRYLPGDGLTNGASVAGRIFYGPRTPTLSFTALLTNTSTEYALLIAQTTGTATIKFQFDATHYIQFAFPSVVFESHERPAAEGLAAVTVNILPKYDVTVAGGKINGVLVVTGKCDLALIAQ